jgi:hypothetical protein
LHKDRRFLLLKHALEGACQSICKYFSNLALKKLHMKLLKLLPLFFGFALNAQEIHRCGTDHYVNHLNELNPGLKENINRTFEAAKQHSIQNKLHKSNHDQWDTVYRIPVVFHVVFNTPAENISNTLLKSQIDVLNADFRRMNSDTSETRNIFKARGADAGIEFFLATIDPDGNVTNGITRTQTTETTFASGFFPNPTDIDRIKSSATNGKDAWDTDKYLNIWIGNMGDALLGYAYPPAAAPNWPAGATPADTSVWGVVVNHKVIGFNNPLAVADADKGRTAVHEVGHYLGLRHIWGDGPLSMLIPDCTVDDGIDDTPNSGNNSQGSCNPNKNTCPDDPEPDMWENYMDYSKEECQNIFTLGQVEVMRSMMVIGRPGLGKIIKDEILFVSVGDYIVINNTDTFIVGTTNSFVINEGDQVMFLHENNGYNYTATNTFVVGNGSQVHATKQGTVSDGSGTTSVYDIAKLNAVSIYPNPSNSTITIEGINKTATDKIFMVDVQGKVVAEILTNGQDKTTFDVSKMSPGLYFANFFKENKLIGSKKIGVF